jgi:four helix bundle protein
MRRCSVSIPSNIAEGSRRIEKEYINFLRTSFGSGSELETQLDLSKRLGFISKSDYNNTVEILSEVMKMLNKMIFK